LEDRRQGQPLGRERWLAAAREERRESVVGEHLAELVRSAEVRMALREGGVGDPRGLGGTGGSGSERSIMIFLAVRQR